MAALKKTAKKTTKKVARHAQLAYRRILLKLSGESLQGPQGFGIHGETIQSIARELKEVHALGVEIAIMVGGGNIFRGARQKGFEIDRSTGDYMGMLATVINALALQDALEKEGVFTRVLSAIEIKADVILKATRVDGIFDADPEQVSGAKFFAAITYRDVLNQNLKVMDATAISLCMDNGMPIVVFNMNQHGNIKRVVMGERVGSKVTPA